MTTPVASIVCFLAASVFGAVGQFLLGGSAACTAWGAEA
jgi:hypothetical protein